MTDPQLELLKHELQRVWGDRDAIKRHRGAQEQRQYRELTERMVRLLIRIEAIEEQESRANQVNQEGE